LGRDISLFRKLMSWAGPVDRALRLGRKQASSLPIGDAWLKESRDEIY